MKQPSLRAMTFKPTERELQNAIVQALEATGCVVLQTGRYVRQVRCPGCGHFFTPHTGYGNTVGTPDLFATRGGNVWVALEIKNPEYKTLLGTIPAGRLSPEQRALRELGVIHIVRSVDEALAVMDNARYGPATR